MSKKSKTTKKALVNSIVSLVLCFVMLLGTTFAWFTDSVTSGRNKIQAGNLDVELYHINSSTGETKVDNSTKLFLDSTGADMLWEPGVVSWETFKVKNVGSLALKYQLAMNLGGNNWVKENGEVTTRSLKDVIDVYIFDGNKSADFINRDATLNAINGMTPVTLSDFVKADTLIPGDDAISEKAYTVVLYWNPGDNVRDNLYDLKNGLVASDAADGEVGSLYIDLGIKLNATQYTKENDSFDDQYDKDADGVNDYTGNATTASSTNTAAASTATTFQISAVPATQSTTSITEVYFEAEALTDGETYVLEATTNDTLMANANYTVSDGNGVVGAIDLTLTNTANNMKVETFNGKTATITTYIAKNLGSVTVSGPAEATITGVSYEDATGKLTFTTNHFSTYIVSSTAEAYIAKTDKAYAALGDAFAEANGDEVTLLRNVDLTSYASVPEGKDVTLDLSGKTLKSSSFVIANYGTLTVKDESSKGSMISTVGCAIYAANNSVTTIESGNIASVEGAVITGDSTGATINVKGGILSASDNAVLAGNGSRRTGSSNIFNISGGTLNGQIKTGGYIACGIYCPWDDIINMSGGTINVTKGAGIVARAGQVNITGGTINTTGSETGKVGDSRVVVPCSAIVFDSDAGYPALTETSKISVSGGSFNSEDAVAAVVSSAAVPARIVITGGTFNKNPNGFVSEGYVAVDVDGKYEIKVEEYWADHSSENLTEENGVYLIHTAEELAKFEQMVNDEHNSFSGATVKLASDIDMGRYLWTPVGQTGATQFQGTFDGDGHTIKNLRINNKDDGGHCATGLFGWLNSAVVKNVTIDGADVKGYHNVGVIAGYMETSGTTIENCHVKNAEVSCTNVNEEANGDKCGGIVGYAGNEGTSVIDCTVSDSNIYAGRDAGQVVGAAKTANVSGCSATNVNVSANGTGRGTNIRNEVIGREL